MKEKWMSVLTEYPFQFFSIVILLTLFLYLIVDYRSSKRSVVGMRITERIQRSYESGERKKFDISQLGVSFVEKQERKIQQALERANVLFTVQEYFTFMLVGMAVGAVIGLVAFPFSGLWTSLVFFGSGFFEQLFGRILAMIVFAIVGAFFPKCWLLHLIAKRKKLLESQLQDALLNIADALNSGHVIGDAIRIAGTELPYPIGPELTKTYRETETGKTMEQALRGLKERVDLPDFDMAVSAMEIQFEVGGKLEGLLRNMVRIIEERGDLRNEIKKTIAESKTVCVILLLSPLFFLVTFSILQGDIYLNMLRNPMGIFLLGVAVVSYIIAALIITYIIKDVSSDQ